MEKQPNLARVNCVGALCYVLGMGELSWNTEYVTHPERLLRNFEEVQRKQGDIRLKNRFFSNRFESKEKTAKRLVDEVSREVKEKTQRKVFPA